MLLASHPKPFLVPVLFAGFVVVQVSALTIPLEALQVTGEPENAQIRSLIQQLDSQSYKDRESAEINLVQLGFPAVRPLIEAVFSERPEIAIRSGRILCEIATRAESEDELLRLAGVFKYLAQNGFQHFGNTAREAIDCWKERRTEKVREAIRATGIGLEVNEAHDGTRVFIDGVEVLGRPDAPTGEDERPDSQKNAQATSHEKLIADIDRILAGEERSSVDSLAGDESATENPDRDAFGMPRRRLVIDGGAAGGVIMMGEGGPIVVSGPSTIAKIDKISEETVNGIRLMRELQAVHQITIEDCEVPDDLVREMAAVPGLQSIVITRCKFKPDEFLELSKTRPEVSVSATGHEAFLGISVQEEVDYDSNGEEVPRLVILTVVKDSAAEDAGIKVGDIFLSIDGNPIASHSQMVLFIAGRQPGDVLNLKIRNEDGEQEIKATLKSRPAGM